MEYNKNILLNSFEIHKATWKPDDLHKVCAILNTQGGSMTFGTRIKPLDKLRHLIEKKLKRIGPSTDNLITLSNITAEDGIIMSVYLSTSLMFHVIFKHLEVINTIIIALCPKRR